MDPATVTALATAAAALLAATGGVLFGQRGSKAQARLSDAQLTEIEHRIAAGLLTAVEERLLRAEARIGKLEQQVHDLTTERDLLERELAVVTGERDQLLDERDKLLGLISHLQPVPESGS